MVPSVLTVAPPPNASVTPFSCETLTASALAVPAARPLILPLSLMVTVPNFGASAICTLIVPVVVSVVVLRLLPL